MNYELIRNANVKVIQHSNNKNKPIAEIIIDNKINHVFDSKSRVSRSLSVMRPESLSNHLNGGSFFVVNDILHDFRYGTHLGFEHTDESIAHLADVVGITEIDGSHPTSVIVNKTVVSHDVALSKKWSNTEITIPEYADGGTFDSELHYGWSPFSKHVTSAFKLTRLVCSNGMIGTASILNNKIPLVNRWEEHLNIASRQIQQKINDIFSKRILIMGNERACIAEANLLTNHAELRLDAPVYNQDAHDRLSRIHDIASPTKQLGDIYKHAILDGSRGTDTSSQCPAHLTTLDLYNMVTEIRSHTNATAKSTAVALDGFANTLVFARANSTMNMNAIMKARNVPKLCAFSDPETAFFGDVA